MAYREVPTIEMQEVIRRWQAGNNQRQIDVRTGLSRDTVHKYVAAPRGMALPGMGRRRRGAAEPASKGQPIEAAAVGYARAGPAADDADP